MAVKNLVKTDERDGRPFRWTRDAYHRLADLGFIGPEERTELIQGEIITTMTKRRPHSIAVGNGIEVLRLVFGEEYHVQVQDPIAIAEDGEPEPDLVILRGKPGDYRETPSQNDVVLLVEVSDTTLSYDRLRKGGLYAQAGIADYWIVNIVERQVEVYRNPIASADSPTGFAYGNRLTFLPGEHAAPLMLPQTTVAVSDLLPPEDLPFD
jgi:Uma2 family endonuclease